MSRNREIMKTTLHEISAGNQSDRHISAEHYSWLANALLHCEDQAAERVNRCPGCGCPLDYCAHCQKLWES
jgi:hypothetical protein